MPWVASSTVDLSHRFPWPENLKFNISLFGQPETLEIFPRIIHAAGEKLTEIHPSEADAGLRINELMNKQPKTGGKREK